MTIRTRLRATARLATADTLGGALTVAAGSAHASQPAATAENQRPTRACPAVIVVGHQSCFAVRRDGAHVAAPAPDIYQHTENFYDVTGGNDGTCSPSRLCTAGKALTYTATGLRRRPARRSPLATVLNHRLRNRTTPVTQRKTCDH